MMQGGNRGGGAGGGSEGEGGARNEEGARSESSGESERRSEGGSESSGESRDEGGAAEGGEGGGPSETSQIAGTAQRVLALAGAAVGVASSIQQGGLEGAVGGIASAGGLVSGVASAAGASDAAATMAQLMSTYSSLGGTIESAVSAFSGIAARLRGETGEIVKLSFKADDTVNSVWTATKAHVKEVMNDLYEAEITLLTTDVMAESSELLGAGCSLTWMRGDHARHLHGIVDEVTSGVAGDETTDALTARIRLVPAVALLELTKRTRVFQQKTVSDILTEVLETELTAYGRELSVDVKRELPECEYRTQYDESDLSFVRRLCGEEGLLFFFDHTGEAEKLCIADDAAVYPPLEGTNGQTVAYSEHADTNEHDAITRFQRVDRMQPTKLTLRMHDYTLSGDAIHLSESEPSGSAKSSSSGGGQAAIGASKGPVREILEHDAQPITFSSYSGTSYGKTDILEQLAHRRARAVQSSLVFTGVGTAAGLAPGTVFTLAEHPYALDGDYVITHVEHDLDCGEAARSYDGAELPARYGNRFMCVPAAVTYRAPRRDKPRVRGVLTGIVVGDNPGVKTDVRGRVRVKFHWDITTNSDALSSCLMRVVQPWAGSDWGFMFTPRVGMEVVVTFLDGDPDRPIVTGCVYNGDNPAPFLQDTEPTRSGIKTRTVDGSGAYTEGYNEISFDDIKDAEQVIIHAQKDFNETVENAHATTVKGGQTNSVGGDRSVSVGGEHSVSVKGSETYTVETDRTTGVKGGKDFLTVGTEWKVMVGTSSISVTDGKIVITTGTSTLQLTDAADLQTSAGAQVYLTANAMMKSSAPSSLTLDSNAKLVSSQGSLVKLDPNAVMASSKGSSVLLDAKASTSSSGGASVVLSANAVMSGTEARVNGTSKATLGAPTAEVLGAGGAVTADAAGATVAGAIVNVTGDGAVNIGAGVVKIN